MYSRMPRERAGGPCFMHRARAYRSARYKPSVLISAGSWTYREIQLLVVPSTTTDEPIRHLVPVCARAFLCERRTAGYRVTKSTVYTLRTASEWANSVRALRLLYVTLFHRHSKGSQEKKQRKNIYSTVTVNSTSGRNQTA